MRTPDIKHGLRSNYGQIHAHVATYGVSLRPRNPAKGNRLPSPKENRLRMEIALAKAALARPAHDLARIKVLQARIAELASA